jgi:hypothetical protein
MAYKRKKYKKVFVKNPVGRGNLIPKWSKSGRPLNDSARSELRKMLTRGDR